MTTNQAEKAGLKVLATVLKRMRQDDQGGYSGRYKGKWSFVSTGLSITAQELDVLFAAVGIVPDEIVSRGHCESCAHSTDGRERGYVEPCVSCARPVMSNFKPKERTR